MCRQDLGAPEVCLRLALGFTFLPRRGRREGSRERRARGTAPESGPRSCLQPWTPGPNSPGLQVGSGPTSQPCTQPAVTPTFHVTPGPPHSRPGPSRASAGSCSSLSPTLWIIGVPSSPRAKLWGFQGPSALWFHRALGRRGQHGVWNGRQWRWARLSPPCF